MEKAFLTVSSSLRFTKKREPTPEKVQKFRKDYIIPLGKTLATRERVEIMEKLKDQEAPFGDRVQMSESTKNVVFGEPHMVPSECLQSIKENIYKSKKNEVLGKGLDRNYDFPEVIKKTDFAFGVPVVGSKLKRRTHNWRDF